VADRFLIVSDVDGTMLGDNAALETLSRWFKPRRDSFRLVYNSGRSTASLRGSIAQTPLPDPDALIGNVGTQIETFDSATPLKGWPTLSGDWDPDVVRQVLGGIQGFEPQPHSYQSPHKVSYFAYEASEAQLADWQSQLEAAGLRVRIVYSSQRDLDVLPAGIDKGAATKFLAEAWNVPPDRVIVCGDTGNDLSMFEQGFLGIVVGNALPELAALDSPRVYHARENFAAGVSEGLRFWFQRVEDGKLART
jgi:sucrose-6F-phosphate phosphohydrolase